MTRLGRYEVVRRLAVGGMAELFLARSATAGIDGFAKLVVLKRLLPELARDEAQVERFLDEARLQGALEHPNVVQVLDVGRAGDETFLALEYVPGRDLDQILRAAAAKQAPLGLEQAATIVLGVCAGLHHAHERRDEAGRSLEIVHRDVSPSNVLLSWDGAVKLLDFGVAKAASQRAVTRDGLIKGKIGYMSPEQCTGEAVDRRSDVFCVGILLWELTTGSRLFEGESDVAVLRQIAEVDAPRPSTRVPGYPPDLEAIVLRALRRDRSLRYRTAQELQIDLENFLREQKLTASPIELGRTLDELFAAEKKTELAERASLGRRQSGGRWLEPAAAAALAVALGCGLLGHRAQTRARNEAVDYEAYDATIRSARGWGLAAGGAAAAGAGLGLAGLSRRRINRSRGRRSDRT